MERNYNLKMSSNSGTSTSIESIKNNKEKELTEVINEKDQKISDLNSLIEELVKENETLKENYSKSISFFKFYIQSLEEKLEKYESKDEANCNLNKEDISKEQFKITYTKCSVCDEILDSSLYKTHQLSFLEDKEIIYKIEINDIEGIINCVKHGFDSNKIIDKENGNCKFNLIIALLHYIALNGDESLINAILQYQSNTVNVDILNKFKDTPLILSLEKGNISIAQTLIDLGADISIKGRNINSPLMICCEKKYNKLAKFISTIDNKTIYDKNIFGETCLQIAERNKNEELVQFFINIPKKIPSSSSSFKKQK